MNKLLIVLLVTCLFYSCSNTKEATDDTPDKPNVIIVITDDQGYGDLGHTGNPIIKTPTLDKFSSESVNLTNYHVGTTCAPTRAGLLTGRNCNRNGVWHTIMGASILNADEVTLANVLNDNDYSTGMFGKWHLGDNHPFHPHNRGFDEALYHGGGGVGQTPDYWNNDYLDDTYFRNGVPEKKSGYCTDVWFDEAIKFIEKNKEEPFFCYLSLNAPHGPYNVPESYYNLYKNETNISEIQKRFYGMITNIDDNFKKLLDRVDELGMAENTIVIFTTDNGTAAGYRADKGSDQLLGYNAGMRGTKGSEYDGGHRVPMIIRWPEGGLAGGKKMDALTAHVDMLPTLASLTGNAFQATKTMDGTDISGYLLGNEEIPKRFLVTDTQRVPWPVKGKNSCVMDGNWRLVNGDELYNVSEDPGQQTNLAEKHPDRVAEMNAFYDQWWEGVIKETRFSNIHLGVNTVETLTCHDAHTIGYYPPWNQQQIRQGKPMDPAPFSVKFTSGGTYQFRLSRWPEESGLALGDEALDVVEPTPYWDGSIKGKSMQFDKAFLKVGDQVGETAVNNDSNAAVITMDVPAGDTELTAYYTMKDGGETNAFYVYVEKME